MFRVANERSNQLTDVRARVILSRLEGPSANRARKFYELSLDRPQVVFFPLHWVVVHPIDEQSPLGGIHTGAIRGGGLGDPDPPLGHGRDLLPDRARRSSYKPQEIAWGMKFADMFLRSDGGLVGIDMRKIHDLEPAP